MKQIIKSLQAKNIPLSEKVKGIKLVKNASILNQDGIYLAIHYGKIIFAYDQENNICEVDLNCSMTSNRQIRYCLRFFNIDESKVIDVHDGPKWNFGGRIN